MRYLRRENVRGSISRLLERVIRDLSQALKRVRGSGAARFCHKLVVVRLAMRDITRRDGRTGFHECPAEEAFSITPVREHVHRDGNRARTLAPSAVLWSVRTHGGRQSTPQGESSYMVTLVGSPPKAEMYFCIHRSARRSAAH